MKKCYKILIISLLLFVIPILGFADAIETEKKYHGKIKGTDWISVVLDSSTADVTSAVVNVEGIQKFAVYIYQAAGSTVEIEIQPLQGATVLGGDTSWFEGNTLTCSETHCIRTLSFIGAKNIRFKVYDSSGRVVILVGMKPEGFNGSGR